MVARCHFLYNIMLKKSLSLFHSSFAQDITFIIAIKVIALILLYVFFMPKITPSFSDIPRIFQDVRWRTCNKSRAAYANVKDEEYKQQAFETVLSPRQEKQG